MTSAIGEGEFTPFTKSHCLALQKVLPASPGGLQKWVDVGFWLVLPRTSRAGAGTCFCRAYNQERGCVSYSLFPPSVLSLGFVATVSLAFFCSLSLYECSPTTRWGKTQEVAPTSSPGQRRLGQPVLARQCTGLEDRAKEQAQERSQTSAGIQLFTITLPRYAAEQLPRLFFVRYKTGSCLFI